VVDEPRSNSWSDTSISTPFAEDVPAGGSTSDPPRGRLVRDLVVGVRVGEDDRFDAAGVLHDDDVTAGRLVD